MFILQADKTQLTVRQREPITSGSVQVYTARFEFSPDWDGMKRVAVFKAGAESRFVLLDDSNACDIPWEVLVKPDIQLWAGVCGTRGGAEILPTIWANLGFIQEGVTTLKEARPRTPDLWERELAGKASRMDYTEDGELGLYSGDRLLSAVTVSSGRDCSIGHGLKIVDGALTVDTTDGFKGDSTLPMTAAGVQAIVGNIEALLGTI